MWTAGKNTDGQLSGVRADSPIFTKVLGLPAVKEIATGSYYCIALTKDDEVIIRILSYSGEGLNKSAFIKFFDWIISDTVQIPLGSFWIQPW